MGNHIAITKDGKHVIGKKLFVTDENSKHRKGKKAFLTKDGKHRLVFSAGNDWAKYSCDVTPAHYVEEEAGGEGSGYITSSDVPCYSSYEFLEEKGYVGVGFDESSPSYAVGRYNVSATQVERYDSWGTVDGLSGFKYLMTSTIVAKCSYVPAAYAKGTADYGKLFADEGELPEAGTLIEGSVADGYCVLQIGGAYYYYEIVQ